VKILPTIQLQKQFQIQSPEVGHLFMTSKAVLQLDAITTHILQGGMTASEVFREIEVPFCGIVLVEFLRMIEPKRWS